MIRRVENLTPGDRIRIAGIDTTIAKITPGWDVIHLDTVNDKGLPIVFERYRNETVTLLEPALTEPVELAVERELTDWGRGNQARSSSVMARDGFRAGARALARVIAAKYPELAHELLEQK